MATRKSRFKHVPKVDVHLWGEMIGSVALDPGYGFYVFAYTPEFARSGIQPAPLQMPTKADSLFMFSDLPTETYKRLPAMLSDALPDDFGNALIDRFMAERGLDRSQVTPLDRLAYMGDRSMGALTFKPSTGPATVKPLAIELGQLVSEARNAVHGDFADESTTNRALRHIIEVGTSAGGARAKAVIAWNPVTNEIRGGQSDAPEDFEHWLLKFDGIGNDIELGASSDYGRIEYAYYLMAKAAGIDMHPCRLLSENGRAHFMTKRFDREGGSTRHHMQTLCAMGHVDFKKKATNGYAQLFQAIRELDLPHHALQDAFRRMVFNVMSKNCDDHSKNFSFRLKQRGAWELAPAYDVTFAHNPRGEWTHQHLMSVNGKFKDITLADFFAEASRFGIGTVDHLIERISVAIHRWPDFASEANLGDEQTSFIQGMLQPLSKLPRRD